MPSPTLAAPRRPPPAPDATAPRDEAEATSADHPLDLAICWFRRDLRDHDHAAFDRAMHRARRVLAIFVFDREILDALPGREDRRVEFIRESLVELDAALRERGGGLAVVHARAVEAIPELARRANAGAVFANHDYEPAAKARDLEVAEALAGDGIAFETTKDQAVFERDEVVTRSGAPFSVYTPYRNAWLAALARSPLALFPCDGPGGVAAPESVLPGAWIIPTLAAIGFRPTDLHRLAIPTGMRGGRRLLDDFLARIDRYHETRDFPGLKGPSYLSVHLRFGTVSIRHLVREAHQRAIAGSAGAAKWLDELVWRDFYFQILDHHPRVVGHAFRPECDRIAFPNDPARLAAWAEGRTGYPIVDAAMRQLNRTGYMHNRLRMIAASFLVKDLHVDWRHGERLFAERLNDYDLAANNGGWQWAASTGCDAQPWFRIFNPVTQSERFDPDGAFIRRYVPELAPLGANEIHAPWRLAPTLQRARGVVIGRDYPPPIVDHAAARARALELFAGAKG
jgi:deoxyribodipyrimidine photo-lyase